MIDQAALKSIEDLHRLKTDGIITEEEFERSKERLLFGGKPTSAAATPTAPRGSFSAAIGIIGSGAPATLPQKEDHLAWITLPLRRYADFEGRSTRREFWMFQLVYVALALIVGMVFATGENAGALHIIVLLLVATAALGLVVPLLAVQARRFHDQNRSGLLVLINFVPYVGAIVVFVMMLMEGTPGENRFGPDPRQAREA